MTRPTISLLKHQLLFLQDQQSLYLGLVGGYRSGKTYSLCHKAIHLAYLNQGYNGALCEPVGSMIGRVLIPTMEQALAETGVPYTHAKGLGAFDLHFPDKTSRIWLLSAENYARIAGVTLAWFGVDEFDLIKFDLAQASWNMLTSRLTKANVMQGLVTSTPEGFKFLHWFFEGEGSTNNDHQPYTDRRLIRASTRDNPFIGDYVERMYRQYPSKLIDAYVDGKFVNMTQGSVYYDFDRIQNFTNKSITDFHQSYPLLVGMDFNVNKMATEIAVAPGDGKVFYIDELYGLKNTMAVIQELKTRYPNRKLIIYPDATGKADKSSAGMSDIAMLKNSGFEVRVNPSNPLRKDRIAAVNSKIKNARGDRNLFINPIRCPRLLKAFEQQGYVNGEPDNSNDIDHPADAGGYIIAYEWPINTGKPRAVVQR
jgi:hypothetical protein